MPGNALHAEWGIPLSIAVAGKIVCLPLMLLGGLWHGASFNFITWGGLNGLGILVYKWWKNRCWGSRLAILGLLGVGLTIAAFSVESPLVNLLWVCVLVLITGYSLLLLIEKQFANGKFYTAVSTAWSVLITFVFISFTRLFFRSGSNLNPAEANEEAWNTASLMVESIGSRWNFEQIPDIVANYSAVFILFAIGMIIHWLPTRFKRRYRIWFASMPLPLLVAVCILLPIILYQFVTADLQPFIYFQF